MTRSITTDVLIIGAGLSGLHCAYQLEKKRLDYCLIEARDRFGGRIFSPTAKHTAAAFDLGPAWFWPGQRRMQNLINELKMETEVFQQFDQGDALYEDDQGKIQKGIQGISMAGSYRIKNGMAELIEQLLAAIPKEKYHLNCRLDSLTQLDDHSLMSEAILPESKCQISSRYVILALPPRIALDSLQFTPAFSQQRCAELNQVATWMAGHAKAVAVYDHAFWREQGLSGDAFSHLGPLHEIHDASQDHSEQSVYALFGFFALTAKQRQQMGAAINSAVIDQLQRLFGPLAAKPLDLIIKDWAQDPLTATQKDQQIVGHHGLNQLTHVADPAWHERLIFAASEVAGQGLDGQRNNGYLEGALEASMHSISLVEEGLNQL